MYSGNLFFRQAAGGSVQRKSNFNTLATEAIVACSCPLWQCYNTTRQLKAFQ